MFDEKLGYDPASPKSIEQYAIQLKDKTFMEVVLAKGTTTSDAVEAYTNKFRKGGLGNLLEEVYFGYKANSNQEADFPEAGVELKATPYEFTKKGELRAGERLVLTMISYEEPIEADFYKSHAWEKMRLILLIYYWRNKQLNSNLLYKIGFINMFTPPEQDLIIIRQDYKLIIDKIATGRAHELSESDTLYLGACTKGSTAEKSTVAQYYGEHIPARKRAFCFKNSYMTYVLNNYIVPSGKNQSSFDVIELENSSLETAIQTRLSKYVGLYECEIANQLNIELNKQNKSYEAILLYRMLGVKNNRVEEFQKAGITVKILSFRKNKANNQHIRLDDVKFMDFDSEKFDDEIIDEETGEPIGWELSELYSILTNRKYLFAVFWEDEKGQVFKGSHLFGMNDVDLEYVRKIWSKSKEIVRNGVELKKVPYGNSFRIENNLPSPGSNRIFHFRPHASKSYYEFKDGEIFGDGSVSDSDLLPNGERMVKQAYWLNRSYIEEQLGSDLRKDYSRR